MVAAFIYSIHTILALYAFITYKKESTGEGLLAVAFVGIIFTVGWTIATTITNLLFAFDWFVKWYWQPLDSWVLRTIRKEISRDTISLLLLTGIEIVFYYFYFIIEIKKSSRNEDKSTHQTTSA